jgi:hypothetical protein
MDILPDPLIEPIFPSIRREDIDEDEDDDFEIEEDNSGHDDDDIYAKEIRDKYKNIKYIDKKPYIYSINNNDVDKWLESMRDKSELLPNNLIDNIINYDIDNVETVITNNIKKQNIVVNVG